MLDNFGMGEFLLLALFALLFFGPQRLPQIGAQLGRWLSKLTSYSKAFMTQWTEEAAAVQGAVQDVISIRDEIRAAQAEIAQTLNAAQQDINQTIAEARDTIREATPTAQGFVEGSGAPALADADEASRVQSTARSSASGDDSAAVSKTQDVVNALLQKQGVLPQADEAEALAVDAEPEDAHDQASPSAADGEDDAYQKNLRAIKEIMARSPKHTPARASAESPQAAADEQAGEALSSEDRQEDEAAQPPADVQTGATQPDGVIRGPIEALQRAQTGPKREVTESAFDKTQRVLNRLMGIEPEEEPEPAAPTESPAPDHAPAEMPATATSDAPPRATDAVQRERDPGMGVRLSEFAELRTEVTLLRRELDKLREELQSLHLQQPAQPVVVPASVDVGASPAENHPLDGASQTKGALDSLKGSPVEDVA